MVMVRESVREAGGEQRVREGRESVGRDRPKRKLKGAGFFRD